MKFTAPLILAAAVQAAPQLLKRQDASSAASSIASSVSAALGTETVSASAAAPSASADYATGLLAALRAREATVLASLIEPLAATLGPVLQAGEWTLLAPGNEYLEAAVASGFNTSDSAAVVDLLSYHLVAGNYPTDALPTNSNVIASTYLGASMLGPNYTQQAIVFNKDQFGTTNLVSQNISVLANATYENVLVKLIDGVLTIPGNVTATLASENAANATVLAGAVSQLFPDLLTALATTQGITVFAPSNEALAPIAGAITSLAGQMPDMVSGIIAGHVLPSVVYSANITDGLTATSLAGTPLTVNVNDTGVFVTANGATAQVIATDFLASNGVVHTINGVLADLSMAAPAMSSAAMASASA